MKILLAQALQFEPALGGANKSNRQVMQMLAARGHKCSVVAVGNQTAANGACDIATGPVLVRTGALLHIHQVLRTALVEQEPEVVLISNEDPGALLRTALEYGRAPVVVLVRTPLALPFGNRSAISEPARVAMFRRAAGVVVETDAVGKYVKDHSGIDAVKLPISFFDPPEGSAEHRRDLIVSINPSTIKGISIFRALAKAFPDVLFGFVPGWATTNQDERSLLDIPGMVRLAGGDSMEPVYHRTRVLLAPSLCFESGTRVSVEAMLRGIPVIASDVGGHREMKLGVDYVLPVNPIERYEPRIDERMLPTALEPAQDIALWENALRSLVNQPHHYDAIATHSRRAAEDYCAGLSIEPFERYLAGLSRTKQPATATRAGSLPVVRRAALANLLRKSNIEAPSSPGLHPVPRGAGFNRFPLSPMQLRLWVESRLHPLSPAYNFSQAIRITGQLRHDLLEQAIGQVVNAHESLRTVIGITGQEPCQTIMPPAPYRLPRIDLENAGKELAPIERDRACLRESLQVFDLERGPLFRAYLIRSGAIDHTLTITVHHIIADGWSFSVFIRELQAAYESLCTGREIAQIPARLQYADFAVWQRQKSSKEHALQMQYWGRQLAGARALSLPVKPNGSTPLHVGGAVTVRLDDQTFDGVNQTAQAYNATLYMILLSLLQVLLFHHSNQQDISVGCPVAQRNHPGLDHTIGFFVNTLVLRTDLSGDPRFIDLLERVRVVCLEAYRNQDVPFESVVEALHPVRSAGRNPLFSVWFVHDRDPVESVDLAGARFTLVPQEPRTARHDLSLEAIEEGSAIRFTLIYRKALFEERTVATMAQNLRRLATAIVAQPGMRLSELRALLTPAVYSKSTAQTLAAAARIFSGRVRYRPAAQPN